MTYSSSLKSIDSMERFFLAWILQIYKKKILIYYREAIMKYKYTHRSAPPNSRSFYGDD